MNVFQLPEFFQLFPVKATDAPKVEEKEPMADETRNDRQCSKEESQQLRKAPSRSRNLSADPCLSKSSSSESIQGKQGSLPRHKSSEGWLALMAHSLQRGQMGAMGAFSASKPLNHDVEGNNKQGAKTKESKNIEKDALESQKSPRESPSVSSKSDSEQDCDSEEDDAFTGIEIQLTPSETSQCTDMSSNSQENLEQVSSAKVDEVISKENDYRWKEYSDEEDPLIGSTSEENTPSKKPAVDDEVQDVETGKNSTSSDDEVTPRDEQESALCMSEPDDAENKSKPLDSAENSGIQMIAIKEETRSDIVCDVGQQVPDENVLRKEDNPLENSQHDQKRIDRTETVSLEESTGILQMDADDLARMLDSYDNQQNLKEKCNFVSTKVKEVDSDNGFDRLTDDHTERKCEQKADTGCTSSQDTKAEGSSEWTDDSVSPELVFDNQAIRAISSASTDRLSDSDVEMSPKELARMMQTYSLQNSNQKLADSVAAEPEEDDIKMHSESKLGDAEEAQNTRSALSDEGGSSESGEVVSESDEFAKTRTAYVCTGQGSSDRGEDITVHQSESVVKLDKNDGSGGIETDCEQKTYAASTSFDESPSEDSDNLHMDPEKLIELMEAYNKASVEENIGEEDVYFIEQKKSGTVNVEGVSSCGPDREPPESGDEHRDCIHIHPRSIRETNCCKNLQSSDECKGSFQSQTHESKTKTAERKQYSPRKDQTKALIRELKHVQSHGPKFFESIDEKIQSWREEEMNRHEQLSTNGNHQDKDKVGHLEAAVRHGAYAEEEASDQEEEGGFKASVHIARKKPPALIRELKHIQCHGPDMLYAIEDKVKDWQDCETRQGTKNGVEEPLTEPTVLVGNTDTKTDQLSPWKKKDQILTSENTECTQSCTASSSSSRKSFAPFRESSTKQNATTETSENQQTTVQSETGAEDGKWDVPRSLAAIVDQVLDGAVTFIPEHPVKESNMVLGDISIEETISSNEEEWTVLDSFDGNEVGCFDFDNLSVASDEDCGIVGPGVSDNVSIVSELSIPTVVSHCAKDVVPAPTVVLRHVTPRKNSRSFFPSELKVLPHLRPTRHEHRRHLTKSRDYERLTKSRDCERIKLRRAKSNPPRLPQMRFAAHLYLCRQNLKPTHNIHKTLKSQEQDYTPWGTLRRCNSDKPVSVPDTGIVDVRYAYTGKVRCTGHLESTWVGPKYILDFSWEELDNVVSINRKVLSESFEVLDETKSCSVSDTCTDVEEITLESSYEEETIYDEESLAMSEVVNAVPKPIAGTRSIGKSDSFYNSVSVSFLVPTIGDNVVAAVMEEAMRIVRTGGVVNVLDIDGAVIKRIQCFPRLQCLEFKKATAYNQKRIETNTESILVRSGLKYSVHANDPRIIHWTATKPNVRF